MDGRHDETPEGTTPEDRRALQQLRLQHVLIFDVHGYEHQLPHGGWGGRPADAPEPRPRARTLPQAVELQLQACPSSLRRRTPGQTRLPVVVDRPAGKVLRRVTHDSAVE